LRAVIQRVKHANVVIDGRVNGEIKKGILILLGIHNEDTNKDIKWLVNKLTGLRIFEDSEGKMNLSVEDIEGEILIISQFTLYGDARKGKRPSFTEAARPEKAIPLYEEFIKQIREKGIKTETGIFGADMKVNLLNDGPVTLIIDSPK